MCHHFIRDIINIGDNKSQCTANISQNLPEVFYYDVQKREKRSYKGGHEA